MSANHELFLKVDGMHCQSCVGKVEAAIRAVAGVQVAEVSLRTHRLRVEGEGAIRLSELVEAVAGAGDYRAERISTPEATSEHQAEAATPEEKSPESLYPLFLIVGFISGTMLCVAWSTQDWYWPTMMRHFMAGFFLVFSFFKLLDLQGFASAFRGYDLLAMRSRTWAFAYPFIEVALGVLYLVNLVPMVINGVTLALMLVGALGVFRALSAKQEIRCACLGTALNLPMTTVTLVEDLTMAVMAALMISQSL